MPAVTPDFRLIQQCRGVLGARPLDSLRANSSLAEISTSQTSTFGRDTRQVFSEPHVQALSRLLNGQLGWLCKSVALAYHMDGTLASAETNLLAVLNSKPIPSQVRHFLPQTGKRRTSPQFGYPHVNAAEAWNLLLQSAQGSHLHSKMHA